MKQTLLLLPLLLLLAVPASAQPYEVHPTPAEVIPPELRVGPTVEPTLDPSLPAVSPQMPTVVLPSPVVISPALPPLAETQAAPAAEDGEAAWSEFTVRFGGGGVTPDLDKVAAVAETDAIGGGLFAVEAGRSMAAASDWMPERVRVGLSVSGLHAVATSLGSDAIVDTTRFSVRSRALWPLFGPLHGTLSGVVGATRGEASLDLDGSEFAQDKVWGAHAELLGGLEASWSFDSFLGGIWWETGPSIESELAFDALKHADAPSLSLGGFDATGWKNAGGLFVGFTR